MKFWEIFLKLVDFHLENKKTYLVIDNYKGVLREFLFDEVVNIDIDNNELVSLEIFFENNRRFIPITQRIPFISLKNSFEFDLNINMKSLNKSTISNEKICLKEIIITYNEELKINPIEFYKKIYNQVFLKDLSLFIKKKISEGSQTHSMQSKNSLEIAGNRFIFNSLGGKIKLNQKIKFLGLYSNRNTFFMLIYQAIFTIKPKQIISVLYCKQKSYLLIFIYNSEDCTYFKQKLERKKILYYIPNLEEIIKLDLLNKLGERIFKVFKNSLLASSYHKSNFNL